MNLCVTYLVMTESLDQLTPLQRAALAIKELRARLDAAEAALVELKLGLSEALRARRTAKRLSQAQLAKRLGSSQSRVAKMEAADRSVSPRTSSPRSPLKASPAQASAHF